MAEEASTPLLPGHDGSPPLLGPSGSASASTSASLRRLAIAKSYGTFLVSGLGLSSSSQSQMIVTPSKGKAREVDPSRGGAAAAAGGGGGGAAAGDAHWETRHDGSEETRWSTLRSWLRVNSKDLYLANVGSVARDRECRAEPQSKAKGWRGSMLDLSIWSLSALDCRPGQRENVSSMAADIAFARIDRRGHHAAVPPLLEHLHPSCRPGQVSVQPGHNHHFTAHRRGAAAIHLIRSGSAARRGIAHPSSAAAAAGTVCFGDFHRARAGALPPPRQADRRDLHPSWTAVSASR